MVASMPLRPTMSRTTWGGTPRLRRSVTPGVAKVVESHRSEVSGLTEDAPASLEIFRLHGRAAQGGEDEPVMFPVGPAVGALGVQAGARSRGSGRRRSLPGGDRELQPLCLRRHLPVSEHRQ